MMKTHLLLAVLALAVLVAACAAPEAPDTIGEDDAAPSTEERVTSLEDELADLDSLDEELDFSELDALDEELDFG